MSEKSSLREAFKQTEVQTAGHGSRNIKVLTDAFKNINDEQESDNYGSGKIIEDFQAKIAEYFGKESAVFFPSGTMAQQIALRIWCDDKDLNKVAYHPLCHLEIHEQDGLKELHHIQPILLADEDRVIQLEDVQNIKEDIACLLLELPQREIGGQLPSFETLVEISDYCRSKEIKLHLDGARLLEILPYYQKTAREICELFDSVYMSVYKGIGGIAGAVLAGDTAFTEKSKVWKRRHGGDLISLYPYIVSADYYFEQRKDKMKQYYEEAKELAAYYNRCQGVSTIPEVPVSNMFHVHIDKEKDELTNILISVYEETGVGLTSYLRETESKKCNFEVSTGDNYSKISNDVLKKTFELLDKKLKEIN